MSNAPAINIFGEFDYNLLTSFYEQLADVTDSFSSDQPIVIRINSAGGDVNILANIYTELMALPNTLYTYVVGDAFSCAFNLFTSVASEECRVISPEATLMWHKPIFYDLAGNTERLNQTASSSRNLEQTWGTIVAKSSGYKTYASMMKAISKYSKTDDFYFTPAEALELGFADSIGRLSLSKVENYEVLFTDA